MSWQDHRRDIFYLVLLGLLVISAGLGLRDPWPADEPRFALIARDMVETGQWLFPHVGGVLYPDKPPVFLWIMAVFYALTGSIRAAFLIPSLLAALGTLVLVYDLGRRLWNPRAGWLAGLLLLVTLQFVMQAKMARIDALLTFFVTLGCYGFLRHLIAGPDWRWYWAGFFAVGLGIITKGVGFLPLLVFIPWFVAKRGAWTGLATINGSFLRWALGPVIMLVAISLWLVPMLLAVSASNDPALLAYRDEILFRQTATRFVEGWHHSNPFWYYLTDVIPTVWFPLNLALLWLIPDWVKRLRAKDARILLPVAWGVLVVLFFSLSEGKRGVYILPALPVLALAAAPFLDNMVNLLSMRRVIRSVLFIAFVFSVYLVVAGKFDLPGDVTATIASQNNIDFFGLKVAFAVLCGLALLISFNRQPAVVLTGFIITIWLLVGWWAVPAVNNARVPIQVMNKAHQLAGTSRLGIVHWKAQHLLLSKRDLTHFGFRRSDFKLEIRDGLAWLLAQQDRVLMVPNDVSMRCLDKSALVDLGNSNRHDWFLVEHKAILEKCRDKLGRHIPSAIFRYAIPVKENT